MDFNNYFWIFVIFLLFNQSYGIQVIRFDDPKDATNAELMIGNDDDNYEVSINIPQLDFPIGQDLSSCFRWFIDQSRFSDPGGFFLNLKVYMNKSATEGIDEIVWMEPRTVPHFWDEWLGGIGRKLSNTELYEKIKNFPWYKNLMAEPTELRPQLWRSFCLLVDMKENIMSLVVNGEKLLDMELKKLSKHFTDENTEWPKAKLTSISFGPKMNELTIGKSIGILTDLNIYSHNIGNQAAMAITGEG